MKLSYELLVDWQYYSTMTTGDVLPLNYICLTDEGNIRMGYAVPDGAAAVRRIEGSPVRQVLIEYDPLEIEADDKH